jgi:hypothetical protein
MPVFKSARSATKLPPAEHFCRLLEVGCATDGETAIRRSGPFLMEKYKSYVSWGLEGLTLDPNAAPEQQFRALASKRLRWARPKASSTCGRSTSLRHQPPHNARELAASIELIGRKVLPAVRHRTGAPGP